MIQAVMLANDLGNQVADGGLMLRTVLMGIGTVFVGLICLILVCKAMSAVVRRLEKPTENAPAQTAAPASPSSATPGLTTGSAYERGALSAVIAAAVAEELGTDISGIRIVSIRRV